jgi:hypothetical protein
LGDGVTENEGLSGSDGLRLGHGVVVDDDVVVDDAAAVGEAVEVKRFETSSPAPYSLARAVPRKVDSTVAYGYSRATKW